MKKHVLITAVFLGISVSCVTLQHPDKKYDVSIKEPTYKDDLPKVLYDEAHLNSHKADGTYKPFLELIRNDGYEVSVNKNEFSIQDLSDYDLLVICNAKSDKSLPRDIGAFTNEECSVINQWVQQGGSLLLIADHHPFGLANKALAQSFGVEMGAGNVTDTSDSNSKDDGRLEFSLSNGHLREHPIIHGYHKNEKISKIYSFTGQSLQGDARTKSIFQFGAGAMEVRPDSIWVEEGENHINFSKPISVKGLSQGIAIEYHKGRVVILGEAAMLTAQKFLGRKFGMNSPKDSDNKQLALNIIHWLTEKNHE